MPNHISSSVYASKMNKLSVNSMKHILRSIVVAQRKLQEREIAREDLKKHIIKVKKEAGKKVGKGKMEKNLAELQNKVNNLVQKEAKLVRSTEYENKTIAELKNKVKELEEELSAKDTEKGNLVRMNKENIKSVKENINMIRLKIENLLERDRRMQELEEKIRKKVELRGVNERVAELEAKFNELRGREEHDEEDLQKIRQRIDQLKAGV